MLISIFILLIILILNCGKKVIINEIDETKINCNIFIKIFLNIIIFLLL